MTKTNTCIALSMILCAARGASTFIIAISDAAIYINFTYVCMYVYICVYIYIYTYIKYTLRKY